MLNYLAAWPLGTGETLGLLAFLSGIVGFLWRLSHNVMSKLEDLTDKVDAVAASGSKRGDEHAKQMVDLSARVSSLETTMAGQVSSENSVALGLARVEAAVLASNNRLDTFIMAMIPKRPGE